MQETNYYALRNYFFLAIFLFSPNLYIFSQGRKIDAEIKVFKPSSGDTIVSRNKGTYLSRFIIKNNGPDTIKIGDEYSINITFGNVEFGYFFKYPSKNVLPGKEDTVGFTIIMTWDTDNTTKFCGTISIRGNGVDSIKKELKTELLNNKFCQTVFHDSRLGVAQTKIENLLLYPNPSDGFVNIELPSNLLLPATLKLINYIGEDIKVVDLSFKKQTVDLSVFPKGIYLFKIESLQEVYYKRVTIN